MADLAGLLRCILITLPSRFPISDSWTTHKNIHLGHIINEERCLSGLFTKIQERNNRLSSAVITDLNHAVLPLKCRLFALFETFSTGYGYGSLAESSLRLTNDHRTIIETCVEWCTGVERENSARLYASKRLLYLWANAGVDVERWVLDFLASTYSHSKIEGLDLCKLLSELICSSNFSVGTYCQLLIANGFPCKQSLKNSVSSCVAPSIDTNYSNSPTKSMFFYCNNCLRRVALPIS